MLVENLVNHRRRSLNNTRNDMLNRILIIIPAIAFIILIFGVAQSFEDDFSDSSLNKWNLFGSPSPLILGSVEGRNGVFDNNGDSYCDSGIVSKDTFSLTKGFTLESDIFMDVTNPSGCWNDAMFGLLKDDSGIGCSVR
jgi:hypothetical protein